MMLEPELPKLAPDRLGELPLDDLKLPLDDLKPDDLKAVENALAQLSLPYMRLSRYLNLAPPSHDKERLKKIDGGREEQRQQMNVRRAEAGAIGKGQRQAVVDHKQGEKAAYPENQTQADRTPTGQTPAGQSSDINTTEPEEEAERRMTDYGRKVAYQAEEAEKKFWDLLPDLTLPPGMTFVPYLDSKAFTSAECLELPLEDAARHWFQALYEKQEVAKITVSALQQKRSWQETLRMAASIRRRIGSAGSAWNTHVDLFREAVEAESLPETFFAEGLTAKGALTERALTKGASAEESSTAKALGASTAQDAPEATDKFSRRRKPLNASAAAESPMDWLAAWAAAEIGERHLLPLMADSGPAATRKQMRQDLTLTVWGAVLSLHAHRLTVPAFCRLPATAAKQVRDLHSSAGGDVDRLAPKAKRLLQATNAPAPDPLAAVIEAEAGEHIWERIRALPPRQRRCLELFLEGCSRQEMAEKMGCKPETVKTHLRYARKRLTSELAEKAALRSDS